MTSKHQNYSRAATKRLKIAWSPGGCLFKAAKKRQLARDLRLLSRVIRGLKNKLLARGTKRVYARKQWAMVGQFKRRQRGLMLAYVRGLQKRERRCRQERVRLVTAMRHAIRRRPPAEIKLARHLRRRFEKALKGTTGKSRAARTLVGCSLTELRKHLEAQFSPGMTWKNHGFYGWHIDHKRPVSSFCLSDPAQQRACFHYTNLQPLWAKENLTKRDHFVMDKTCGAAHISE